MPDCSATSYREAYQKIFTYFKVHDADVNMIILENETSVLVEKYFESVKVEFQYVPPSDHRSNRAERAIQSFKNPHDIVVINSQHPVSHEKMATIDQSSTMNT